LVADMGSGRSLGTVSASRGARAGRTGFALKGILDEDFPMPHQFSMKISDAIIPVIFEFRALGHDNAADTVGSIFKAYLSKAA